MNSKSGIFALVLLVASFVVATASPINFFDFISDSSEDQFLSRLVDYFNGDVSDSASSANVRAPVNAATSNKSADCKLPMKRGMCRALLPRWRYDPESKDCSEFKFGGCDGNGNNFKSYSLCKQTCAGV